MMLRLPQSIRVQLVDPAGNALRESNVLIGINLLSHGNYFYGNLIGLTDSRGVAVVSGEELEARYRSDQVAFPMDYRLELIECDSSIEISLLNDREIQDALRSLDALPIPSSEPQSAYEAARNAQFEESLQRVAGDSKDHEALTCFLTTRRR